MTEEFIIRIPETLTPQQVLFEAAIGVLEARLEEATVEDL